MNQGRIWTVVNPSVGLPLLIGGVAVTSLLVHASVLTHTTWMGGYWQGNSKAKVSAIDTAPQGQVAQLKNGTSFTITVTPATDAAGKSDVVVNVAPEKLALATQPAN